MLFAGWLAFSMHNINADGTDDFYEGVKFYRAWEYDDAAEPFRKAAEQGDGEAQFLLGRMHYDGTASPSTTFRRICDSTLPPAAA